MGGIPAVFDFEILAVFECLLGTAHVIFGQTFWVARMLFAF